MQFIDLGAQQRQELSDGRTIRDAVEARIAAVLNHGRYILGPEVEELETTLATYVGVHHCVAVASGTDALEGEPFLCLHECGRAPGASLGCTSQRDRVPWPPRACSSRLPRPRL